VPSSEGVVGLVDSKGRDGETEPSGGKTHQMERIGTRATSLGGKQLPQLQHSVRDRASLSPTLTVPPRPTIAAAVHSKNTTQLEYMRLALSSCLEEATLQ
jgi:hypothetical protein